MGLAIITLLIIIMFGDFGLINGAASQSPSQPIAKESISRSKFPKGFLFGAGTSAYQVEGAVREDGRLPCIWDTFTHMPNKTSDGSTGDVAVDQYHRFKEDLKMLKGIGMDVFRFSIAWTRIFPKGSSRNGPVNLLGIQHYNTVINSVIDNGLTPFVTLFHWDTPQVLGDEYNGWLSKRMIDDFVEYAEVCFREFGDRVKYWATVNEPSTFATSGYDTGSAAPGRCSYPFGNCSAGNSSTEPYIVVHNQLLAHSAVVKLYRAKFQASQKGRIGFSINTEWSLPFTHNDSGAAQRVIDFNIGWLLDPVTKGTYPESMKVLVKDRMPKFTEEESRDLKGSFDWIGLNYYFTQWATDNPFVGNVTDYNEDDHAKSSFEVNGVYIGTAEGLSTYRYYPLGLRMLVNYVKENYDNPLVYITEIGYVDEKNGTEALMDKDRTKFHEEHLQELLIAILGGANIKGYMVWSFVDDMEWSSGYTEQFGLFYVDRSNNLQRYAKFSAMWFKYILSY